MNRSASGWSISFLDDRLWFNYATIGEEGLVENTVLNYWMVRDSSWINIDLSFLLRTLLFLLLVLALLDGICLTIRLRLLMAVNSWYKRATVTFK